MPFRLRRGRLTLGAIVFVLTVFFYLHRDPADTADGYLAGTTGGGAVIRVEPDAIRKPQSEHDAVLAPASVERFLESHHAATSNHHSVPTPPSHPDAVTPSTSRAAVSTPPAVQFHDPYFRPGHYAELPIPAYEGKVEAIIKETPIYWSSFPEHFPVTSIIALPSASPKSIPQIQYRGDGGRAEEDRLAAVRAELKHAWEAYGDRAWGADEIQPVSGSVKNPFNGWGATLVDTLDTLWIMGMKKEFDEAVKAVGNIDFTTSFRADIPLFETTIRYLGGLLGAYDVSGGTYQILLDKAVQLAEVLYGAFDTPNRMPEMYYQWRPAFASQPHRARRDTIMSELGSMSMEFTRLAQLTKESKYYDAIARITDALEEMQNRTMLPGMWPLSVDATGCGTPPSGWSGVGDLNPQKLAEGRKLEDQNHIEKRISEIKDDGKEAFCLPQGLEPMGENGPDTFSLSGMSDSTYEYLPKQYLLLGGNVQQYKSMFFSSARAIVSDVLFRPMTEGDLDILLPGKMTISRVYGTAQLRKDYEPHGEHLSCFAGGMFALAGKIFDRPEDVEIGSRLTHGCVWAYNSTVSGIMPEAFNMIACENKDHCAWNKTEYWHNLAPGMDLYEHPPQRSTPQTVSQPMRNTSVERRPHMRERQLAEAEVGSLTSSPVVPGAPSIPQPIGSHHQDTVFPIQGADPVPARMRTSIEIFVKNRIEYERLPSGVTGIVSREYKLRPEAIESVFYMYRITGDRYWRDAGWNMFNAIKQRTRAEFGHSAINDVTSDEPLLSDSMESFWTAETLKYFYLLFDDKDTWSLDEWVINTEAHLFRLPR